jgi:Zn-dependent peptidase ImmA (M78 family)/DNA-binding XRE family transcriptional regulator
MNVNDASFNYEMLVIGRESRGLTQKELASKLDISAAQLSRIEVGLRNVKDNDLKEKIQNTLNYPLEFFFQQQPIYGMGVSELFHRKRKNISDKLLNKIYAQIYLRSTEMGKLLRGVDIGEINIRPVDISDFDDDAAEIARMTRMSWKLPHGAIRNLTSDIENAGGIVIPFDFETRDIDAISHWPRGMPPLFFINVFSPPDRVRFTLCHELGHIIMHRTAEPNSERQADEFAAEFLMPGKEIKTELSDLSLQKLAFLKQYWKVSMAALITRATNLKQITPRHARTLWMTMGKFGYRTREPIETDIPAEKPVLLNSIIELYTHDMDYNVLELSKLLSLTEKETYDLYINNKQFVRDKEKKAAVTEALRIIRSSIKDADRNVEHSDE